MRPDQLPTRQQIIDNAAAKLRQASNALSEAASWLRSDWQPTDSPLTSRQAADRTRMRAAITAAKAAIEEGLHGDGGQM